MSTKKFKQTKEDIKETPIPVDKNEGDLVELDMDTFIKRQENEIKTAESTRADFISKQGKWFRQRFGLRKKATFPWYNSSSQHLPLQDKHIRAMKPEYVAVAYNTFPMCELTVAPIDIALKGVPPDQASQILDQQAKANAIMGETASFHFDWLLRTRMDVFEDIVLMADKHLEKGFCFCKTIYDKVYEPRVVSIFLDDLKAKVKKNSLNPATVDDFLSNPDHIGELIPLIARIYEYDLDDASDAEKVQNICIEIYKGTEVIEFTVQEKKYDAPRWVVLDPSDIIVPSDSESTFDLEKCRWICHQYYVTPAQVMDNMRTKKWKKEACESLLHKAGVYDDDMAESKYKVGGKPPKDNTLNEQKRTREGVGIQLNNTEKNILIREVCLWFDSDGDGIEERHILEYAEGQTMELRFIRYPYSMRMWPYVKIPFCLEDTRHYSVRGTVEIEEPMATALNVQHNMKINRQTIASTPTLIYAANKVNPNNFQYIPGQAVPVEPPLNQNVQWFMPPSIDQTFEREETILKSWSEEILAASDYGAQVPNQSGTAKEYLGMQNSRVGIRQLDIQVWQKALKEIYKRTFALWIEFSSDAVFTYTDSDGSQKQVDKTALARDYMFQPMGSFGSSNPQLSAQIAARMFETFQGDTDLDQYELKREYITKQGDARLAKRILKSKQEIQAQNDQMTQMTEQQHKKQLEEMIMLAQLGVKVPAGNAPMPQGRPAPRQHIGGKQGVRG